MNAVRLAKRAGLLLVAGLVVGLVGKVETAESPLPAPPASQPFGAPAFEGDPFSMLASPAVREELELEEVQSNELAKIRREMERELDTLRRNLAAKYQKEIARVLEPQQDERMSQIALQMRGVAALFDADVAKKLGLSDEQRKSMFVKREAGQAKADELRDSVDEGPRAKFQAMRDLQAQTEKAIWAVLTAKQRQQYDELKGKPFDRRRFFEIPKQPAAKTGGAEKK